MTTSQGEAEILGQHRVYGRNMRLAGGRRVRVTDLVRAGLLFEGDELVFNRPRLGASYRASIDGAGHICLPDGEVFASPSSAANAATGGSIDGWNAWVIQRSGDVLDKVRQDFLNTSSTTAKSGVTARSGDGVDAGEHVRAFLQDQRAACERRETVEITVQELIARWGVTDRSTSAYTAIEDDLLNYGLITKPDFRKVSLFTHISLFLLRDMETDVGGAFGGEREEEPYQGLTVGNLQTALSGVEAVGMNASFDEAITKLVLNDYSQLAVLEGPYNLKGAVTWRSIAQCRHVQSDALLGAAVVMSEPVPYDTELVDVLGRLFLDEFFFVRGPKNEIAGIVTAADVVQEYGNLSLPFLLIGQIDLLLRRLLSQSFDFNEVAAICDPDETRKLAGFDDLSLGDYQRVLEVPSSWERIGWPFDRVTFVHRLDEIREERNAIMHFDPISKGASSISVLRTFMMFLKRYVV